MGGEYGCSQTGFCGSGAALCWQMAGAEMGPLGLVSLLLIFEYRVLIGCLIAYQRYLEVGLGRAFVFGGGVASSPAS